MPRIRRDARMQVQDAPQAVLERRKIPVGKIIAAVSAVKQRIPAQQPGVFRQQVANAPRAVPWGVQHADVQTRQPQRLVVLH